MIPMRYIITILVFIIGVIYGYVKPGKEPRWELFKKGALYGVILGIICGLIFFFSGEGLLVFEASVMLVVIAAILFAAIFIFGTFIGDVFETKFKKA
jgi:hypothetical protein